MRVQLTASALLMFVLLSGCGTSPSTTNRAASNVTSATTTNSSQSSGPVNPKIYLVTQTIYQGVTEALRKNQETSFDAPLETIADIGQNSAPGTPNSILYEDAATIVAMDYAINGEGGPTSQYRTLDKILKKTKADLDKYHPKS